MERKIGSAAGKIWFTLQEKGPMPMSQLAKATGLSSELVNQGLGWLAREGKLEPNGSRSRILGLKGQMAKAT